MKENHTNLLPYQEIALLKAQVEGFEILCKTQQANTELLEAEVAVLREALEMWKYPRNYPLRAFTDEEMNERIERTQKALTQTRAPLLLEVVRAAEDLTDYSKVITKNKFDVLKAAVDAYRESK